MSARSMAALDSVAEAMAIQIVRKGRLSRAPS